MTTRDQIEARLDAMAKDIEATTEFVYGPSKGSVPDLIAAHRVCSSVPLFLRALRSAIIHLDDAQLATVLEHLRP